MKTLESVPVHSAAKFTWNQGQATAERSSFGRTPLDGRVWADSMDTGFYMVSPNTGAKKLFLLTSERRDSDGVQRTCNEEEGVQRLRRRADARRSGEVRLVLGEVIFNHHRA